jgi:hypothetical protein
MAAMKRAVIIRKRFTTVAEIGIVPIVAIVKRKNG